MEKSIETIWKEGFLNSDALVAPKLNDLYNQKSIDVVDKFKRMYKVNLISIVAFSFIVLPVSFLSEVPYLGILMFILFNLVVLVNLKFKKKLEEIDKNVSCYHYIKSFDNWMKEILSVNAKINRFLYSYVFLAIIIGFWFGGFGGNVPGEELIGQLLLDFPNTLMFLGLPLFGIIGVFVIILSLSFLGARIGKLDFKIVYGRILQKIDELLADMEEIKNY